MKFFLGKNVEFIPLITMGVFVLLYLLVRAAYVPILHDEAATFFYYIHNGKFIPPNHHWYTNNHIINSAFSFVCYKLMGLSLFSLRLPNVLMYVFYFYFCFKVSRELTSQFVRWTLIISLTLATGLIEFFGVARGYGLSIAFIMGASWHLMQFLKNYKATNQILCLTFASLSVFANLNLIITGVIINLIVALGIGFRGKNQKIVQIIGKVFYMLLFGVIPMLAGIILLNEYKKRNLLDTGTLDGFWDLSVSSLINLIFHSQNVVFSIVVLCFFALIIVAVFYALIDRKVFPILTNQNLLFFWLLIGNIIAVIILGEFFNVNYPEDRTAIQYFVFFVCAFLFALDFLLTRFRNKGHLILLLPFLFFPIQFLSSLNVTNITYWPEQRLPSRFYERVLADSESSKMPFLIGGNHMRNMSWAYLDLTHEGLLNQIQHTHYPDTISDYQIAKREDNPKWGKLYEELDYDAISELSLLRIKKGKEFTPIINPISFEVVNYNQEFFNIYQSIIDSLRGNVLKLEFDFLVESHASPFKSMIVAEVTDKDGKHIEYEYISLDWKKSVWTGSTAPFKGSLCIFELPENAHNFKVYLWNIESNLYSITSGNFILSKMSPN